MPESPTAADKWLDRISKSGSLIVSLVALYFSAQNSDEPTRKLAADVNGRFDKMHQSFGEMNHSFSGLQETVKKLEQDKQLLAKKVDLEAAQAHLTRLESQLGNRPAAVRQVGELRQEIATGQSRLDQLLQQSSPATPGETQAAVGSLAGLQAKTRQWDWLALKDQQNLSGLLASSGQQLRPPPSFAFPTLDNSMLSLPFPEKKSSSELAWDWIKAHPWLAALIAAAIVMALRQK